MVVFLPPPRQFAQHVIQRNKMPQLLLVTCEDSRRAQDERRREKVACRFVDEYIVVVTKRYHRRIVIVACGRVRRRH